MRPQNSPRKRIYSHTKTMLPFAQDKKFRTTYILAVYKLLLRLSMNLTQR